MGNNLRVAIIGLGHWGPNMVRALIRNPKVEVKCAVDSSAERRALVAESIPGIKLLSSVDECFGDNSIDAVIIATPTETHHQLGMRALKAGKHALIEKPLAHAADAAKELSDLAKSRGLVLMTGHTFLYNQGIVEMKRLVDTGDLGELLYMRSVRTNLGPIRNDVNALWDLASHDISIFNFIFNDTPIRVSCTGCCSLGMRQQDIAMGTLEYPKNRIGTFFVSWLDPRKIRDITVVGDQKMLTFDDMNPQRPLKLFDKGVKFQPQSTYSDTFQSFRMSIHQGQMTELEASTGEPLKNECDHFVDCVINKKSPLSNGIDGVKVVRILEGLTRSMNEHGAPVSLWNQE